MRHFVDQIIKVFINWGDIKVTFKTAVCTFRHFRRCKIIIVKNKLVGQLLDKVEQVERSWFVSVWQIVTGE